MVPDSFRATSLAALLVASLALAGVAVGPAAAGAAADTQPASHAQPLTQDDGNESVVTTFRERLGSLDGYIATQATVASIDDRTTNTSTRYWADIDGERLRAEVRAPASRAGVVTVTNATTQATYDPDENVVRVIDRTESGADVTSALVTSLADAEAISYEATVRQGDERLHRLSISGADTQGNVTTTAWVDAETYFPTRLHSAYEYRNRTIETTVRYENVTLDPDFTDDTFRLDPPADATYRNYDQFEPPEQERFETLDALRAGVSFDVPQPEPPEAFEFASATLLRTDSPYLTLRYTDGTDRLSVSVQYERSLDSDLLTKWMNETGVDGRTVYTANYDGHRTVVWTCGNNTYSVNGEQSRATLLAVAGSMECP